MKSSAHRLDIIARGVILFFLALFAVCYVWVALARISYPFELEWNEGGVLCHVLTILRGEQLYVPPNADFFPWTYTPLYYYAVALISLFTGLHFWVGRAISLISSLLSTYLLYRIASRETARREAGFVAAALFLAAYGITGFWYDLVRMDSLALALLLGGFYFIRFGQWRAQIAAALLLTFAVLTKQNLGVFYPFAVICAARGGKKSCAALTLSLILSNLIAIVSLDLCTGGQFSAITLSTPMSHGLNIPAALRETGLFLATRLPLFTFALAAVVVMAAVAAAGKCTVRGEITWLAAFMGAYLCYASTQSHPGAYRNVVIPVVIFGSLLTGLLWGNAASWRGIAGRAGRIALCIVAGFQLWLFRYDPRHQIPTRREREAGDALIARLRRIDGKVLMSYHPFYPVMAGKEPGFHHDALFDRYARGERAREPRPIPPELLSRIERREYRAIILDEYPEFLDIKQLGRAIERNYVLAERLFPEGTEVFCPKTGWIIRPDLLYLPKGPNVKELLNDWPLQGTTDCDFIRILDQFATKTVEVISSTPHAPGVVIKDELRGAVMTGSERVAHDEYRLMYNLPGYGFRTGWITVPAGAVLKLGIGFWQETALQSDKEAMFTVSALTRGGQRTVLFTGRFNPQKVSEYGFQRWEKVDLGHLAGSDIRLIFSVISAGKVNDAVDWPVWIDPCIVFPRAQRELPRAQSGTPNVIIILADALRPYHLPVYGYARDTAPHITSLAGRGIVFLNAFSQAPWTKPAVGSLFTGLYPYQHRALIAVNVPEYRTVPELAFLSRDCATLAELFRRGGRKTAGFNTNVHLLRAFGFARGFDYWADMGDISSEKVADDALRWIDDHATSPFFVYIHLMTTHSPYRASRSLAGHFQGAPPGLEDRPLTAYDHNELIEEIPDSSEMTKFSDVINKYDDAVADIDSQVGRIDAYLAQRGLRENTFIVLLADHGEALSEHGNYFHGWTAYNEMLRVPLIVAGPGGGAGKRVASVVETRDIFPTLVDLAGLDLKGDTGAAERSLKKLVGGGGADAGQAYSETEILIRNNPLSVRSALSCVQDEQCKLVRDFRKNTSEWYNLKKDPAETASSRTEDSPSEKKWDKLLDERGHVTLTGLTPDMTEDSGNMTIIRKELRALGYIN